MVYNLTPMGNTTGLLAFVQLVNSELMFDLFGILILIVACSIAFITFLISTNDTGKSLTTTAYLGVGFAILLRTISLIPDLAFFIIVIIFAGTLAILWKR